jgi:prevent-host-death family protein
MTRVGMHEAKTHFSQLVERALAGEEIVVTRRGEPAVRLAPVERTGERSELFGLMAGEIELADDFDTLPDDIAEALGARE